MKNTKVQSHPVYKGATSLITGGGDISVFVPVSNGTVDLSRVFVDGGELVG